MDITITLSDIFAIVALVLSGYAIWTTSKFNKRQLPMIDSQEALNKNLLEQGESEALEARKADLNALLVNQGSSKRWLKVFNKGKASARNVRIEFPDGNDVVVQSDINEKFPMEILEQHQSVNLIASVHLGTSRKHKVILRWEDDHSNKNEKPIYLTL